jgi:hypothetical protein
MLLKPMDPRITLKLLEGHPDTITQLAQEREKFYQSQSCPQCGGNAFVKRADSRILFTDEDPLPRFLLECSNCKGTFDPHSGIIVTMGNLGRAFKPTIPILDPNKD